jgi:hypothetical protein
MNLGNGGNARRKDFENNMGIECIRLESNAVNYHHCLCGIGYC